MGDEFLVIGCDGIWEKCENEDAVEFVRMRLTAEKSAPSSLSQVCAEICDRGLCPTMDGSDPAFDGKGCDNMTVMVVQLLPNIISAGLKRPGVEASVDEPEAKCAKKADEGT